MSYFLVTQSLKLLEPTSGEANKKEVIFNPSAIEERSLILEVNPDNKITSESGQIFYKQDLKLSDAPNAKEQCYWVSDSELKTNNGLVELVKLDTTNKFLVLKDTEAYVLCTDAPRHITIPKNSTITLLGTKIIKQFGHWFSVDSNEDLQNLTSHQLMYAPNSKEASYYNPTLLKPIN